MSDSGRWESMGSIESIRISPPCRRLHPSCNTYLYPVLGLQVGLDTRTLWNGGDPSGNADDPNELPPDRTKASFDVDAFDAVGKRGIGDIDLSTDETTLYGVNMFHGLTGPQLFAINVTDPSTPVLAGAWTIPNPTPGCSNAGEPAPDDRRPWGLKYHAGKVYVGTVCSAETSQDVRDLEAYVQSYDQGTGMWSTLYGPIELGAFARRANNAGTPGTEATWRPWTSTWPAIPVGLEGQAVWAQPILSDIEFDMDGTLMLGFLDRWGYQTGEDNFGTNFPSPMTYGPISSGDVMRVCNVLGSYQLELNGSCGGVTTYGAGNGDGNGGGEYYWGDQFSYQRYTTPASFATHAEIALGGLAFWPGSGELVTTAFNPTLTSNSAGVVYLINSPPQPLPGGIDQAATGRYSADPVNPAGVPQEWGYRLYESTGGNNGYLGKASGLGDIEYACTTMLVPTATPTSRAKRDAGSSYRYAAANGYTGLAHRYSRASHGYTASDRHAHPADSYRHTGASDRHAGSSNQHTGSRLPQAREPGLLRLR